MVYEQLQHKFHFVLISRSFDKSPFHFRENLLCCKRFQPFIYGIQGYSFPGYREILIDIKKTQEQEMPVGAKYEGGYWEFDVWLDDIRYCKKCYKNLLEYIKEELNITQKAKDKLFEINAQEIKWYHSYEIDKNLNR